MKFHSILFSKAGNTDKPAAEPAFFTDLNLDQIVAAIVSGREEYDLKPFFHMPLDDVGEITFRQEIMRDLEEAHLIGIFKTFTEVMREVRQSLGKAQTRPYKGERERWLLEAAELYCDCVTKLAEDMSSASFTSQGLSQFQQYAIQYAATEHFLTLIQKAAEVKAELASIRYGVLIRGFKVEVCAVEGQAEYSKQTERLFERFRQNDTEPYPFKFSQSDEMNQIDSMIFDLVSKRSPDVFRRLSAFCVENQDFLDPTIVRFNQEIQFYIAYLDHIGRFRKAGLSFCYPQLSLESKDICSDRGFDLALAEILIDEQRSIVCNDFHLEGQERAIVVTGPNQGGKTTFARAFGQMHYLASLGCPVPGTKALLLLCDVIFTHFEKQEEIADLRGKLKDDLVRIHAILEQSTPRSIVIVNEIFSSTALQDARDLSRKILEKFMHQGLLCVWVTFVDEVASLGDGVVSMASTMVPDSPSERTFKVIRRPADGLAYALSIARKHRLTSGMIEERLKS